MDIVEKKLLQKLYHREYYKKNKQQIIENSKEYRKKYYEKKKQVEIENLKKNYPIYYYLSKDNNEIDTSRKKVYKTKKNPFGIEPIFKIEHRKVIVSFD